MTQSARAKGRAQPPTSSTRSVSDRRSRTCAVLRSSIRLLEPERVEQDAAAELVLATCRPAVVEWLDHRPVRLRAPVLVTDRATRHEERRAGDDQEYEQ